MTEESFLREVEDELRSEKLRQFWRRFAPFIVGAVILIVVAVAGNEIWKWWRGSSAAGASDRFYAAVNLADAGDLSASRAALDVLAADGPGGYATLARFRAAATLAAEGDHAGAVAAYDALSSSLSEPRLRELALVLAAYAAVDGEDSGAVENRVGGLAASDSLFRNQAREAIGLARYRAGDIDAAREQFETIAADPAASQDLQIRAFLYLEHLASTGVAVDLDLIEAGQPALDLETQLAPPEDGLFPGAEAPETLALPEAAPEAEPAPAPQPEPVPPTAPVPPAP